MPLSDNLLAENFAKKFKSNFVNSAKKIFLKSFFYKVTTLNGSPLDFFVDTELVKAQLRLLIILPIWIFVASVKLVFSMLMKFYGQFSLNCTMLFYFIALS